MRTSVRFVSQKLIEPDDAKQLSEIYKIVASNQTTNSEKAKQVASIYNTLANSTSSCPIATAIARISQNSIMMAENPPPTPAPKPATTVAKDVAGGLAGLEGVIKVLETVIESPDGAAVLSTPTGARIAMVAGGAAVAASAIAASSS